ncbi:MAG: protein phosphatase 2C domain-containing protein [Roseobacter sp.]|jgi:serine/threonine protein phosphatase PrpC
MRPVLEFDAASALSKGQRSYQEDAMITDLACGAEVGCVVLADGMGGHAAGDVASKIVVSEVYNELMSKKEDPDTLEANVTETLRRAAMAANGSLRDHVRDFPETRGMGSTLVASVIVRSNLYWISIGDSPLFLFREGALVQLNEDHSMAPQIDFMVKSGLLTVEEGVSHPDRNILTSVLFGAEVPKIDCPKEPVALQAGDILIVASDGLQFLTDIEIEAALRRNKSKFSSEIVEDLLQRVMDTEDPQLDNVSFTVVKVLNASVRDVRETDALSCPDIRCVG